MNVEYYRWNITNYSMGDFAHWYLITTINESLIKNRK